MKKISIVLLALAISVSAHAQYSKIDAAPDEGKRTRDEIIQIDQVEGKTVIYFEKTVMEPCTSWASDYECIRIAGEKKVRKVKTSLNIPLGGSDCKLYFPECCTHYYALVFDEFPLDQPFDIVDKKDNSVDFENVTVDTSVTTEKIDAESLFEETPMTVRGDYYDDGSQMTYFSRQGLTVTMHAAYNNDYGKLMKLYFEVANETGHNVDFRTDKISVVNVNKKTNRESHLKLLSFGDFDQKVVNNLGWSSSPDYASRQFSSLSQRSAYKDDVGGAVAYGLLSIVSSAAVKDEVARHNEALNAERDRAVNSYMKSNTIPNEETYGGFVAFKYTNRDKFIVKLELDGFTYTWTIID